MSVLFDLIPLTGQEEDIKNKVGVFIFNLRSSTATSVNLFEPDSEIESDEVFLMKFRPNPDIVLPGDIQVTVINDDFPVLSIPQLSVYRSTEDIRMARIPVTLSEVSPHPVSFSYLVRSRLSATTNEDFLHRQARVTFAPGEVSKELLVPILPGLVEMDGAGFIIAITDVSGAIVDTAVSPISFKSENIRISIESLNENSIKISFNTLLGFQHRLQITDDVTSSSWVDTDFSVVGNDLDQGFNLDPQGNSFYRIISIPEVSQE